MDFDSGSVAPIQYETENVGPASTAGVAVAVPLETTDYATPMPATRYSVPLQIDSTAPQRKKRKLTTDQIVAIVLLLLILVGVLMMTLALTGVFNRSGPTVSLTPVIVPASGIPSPLPSIVPIA